jgi:hypothetical protein
LLFVLPVFMLPAFAFPAEFAFVPPVLPFEFMFPLVFVFMLEFVVVLVLAFMAALVLPVVMVEVFVVVVEVFALPAFLDLLSPHWNMVRAVPSTASRASVCSMVVLLRLGKKGLGVGAES